MSLPNDVAHYPILVKLEFPVIVGFGQLTWTCACGQSYFWLLTQDEIDVAILLLGRMRQLRKESDETVISEEFSSPEELGEVHLGEGVDS